jgi:UDP-N-acetylmuramate-alanine ligase
MCCDNRPARELAERKARQGKSVVLYGVVNNGAAWRAVDVQPNHAGGSDYVLLREGQSEGLVRLRVPGLHNVANCSQR